MDPSIEDTSMANPSAATQRERHAHGMAVRREVPGDAHVDRAVAATTPFTADFQEFITRYAWGEVWARPGLDRRTRSCVTLAILASLGCEEELAMHVRAALRNGVSRDEIGEVLLQAGLYAGVQRSNRAFAVADRALQAVHDPADHTGADHTGADHTGTDHTGPATGTEGHDGGARRAQ